MDWSHLFARSERPDRPDLDETVINGTPYDVRRSTHGFAAESGPRRGRLNADRIEALRRRALAVVRAR